ncbi:hypothetical protein P153DRAFT_6579 [Dothidotthia symphoricarpi CBS 119687]|uniref:Uncharacterized protein n=1 Tax=Dothidotthia symphoricarpi CBS 119687 TaxID=1392245 RepID=A0A6A6AUJ3_9PLEO|nr:uncharacterized protein P153DRAFT_6579 [Dothidotthia symphoricarpi CBS 119687]KAF2134635.1 hypothetical protein P153DRAFT_6579 [Dothidotthia symphoricarpi CBS 119687]
MSQAHFSRTNTSKTPPPLLFPISISTCKPKRTTWVSIKKSKRRRRTTANNKTNTKKRVIGWVGLAMGKFHKKDMSKWWWWWESRIKQALPPPPPPVLFTTRR